MRRVMEKVSAVSFIVRFSYWLESHYVVWVGEPDYVFYWSLQKNKNTNTNPRKSVIWVGQSQEVCAVLLAFLSPGRPCPYWKGLSLFSIFLSFLFPSFLSLEDIRRISEINSTIWSNLSQKINFLGIIVVMTSKLTSIISPFWKETNKADLFSSQPIWWFVGEKFCCFLFLFFFLPQSFHKIIAAG